MPETHTGLGSISDIRHAHEAELTFANLDLVQLVMSSSPEHLASPDGLALLLEIRSRGVHALEELGLRPKAE